MTQDKSPRDVALESVPIELCKLLKLENLVASGGEAKMVITDQLVRVNGAVETRKRKKIGYGDIVAFGGEVLRIVAP